MDKTYGLIVIGSGAGGSGAARRCRKAGWTVAMIDERPFGGTCALRGCDMKKILAASAEVVDYAGRMHGYGLDAQLRVDWPELMAYKRSFIKGYSKRFETGLKEEGIDAFHGNARFVAENEIEVDGRVLKGGYILIATGAKARELHIPGEEYIASSDDFLELDALPERIVFLGGGMISMEFAHIAARAGATVHVIEAGARPLLNFDKELAQGVEARSKEIGIRFMYKTEIREVRKKENQSFIVVCSRKGEEMSIEADLVVHGAGRSPNIRGLDLEAGGVDFSPHGIVVNHYMQSVSNQNVYAAGDAADTPAPKLTPVAGMESSAAGRNMLYGNKVKPDYSAVPAVLFTVPRLASVGFGLQKAKEAGYDAYETKRDMSGWYTYRRTHEKVAMAKIVLEKQTHKILGAHFVGGEADELVNYFAMAISQGLSAAEMKKQTFAYPTAASDIEYMF